MNDLVLGLGSNLGSEVSHFAAAVEGLSAALGPLCASSLYRTEPISEVLQPDFLNLVLLCRTDLDPWRILYLAQDLELQAGRRRDIPNGPRTLDIDLLAYGSLVLPTGRLLLPHPRLRQRRFVLAPWSEIAPSFPLPPDGKTVQQALGELTEDGAVEKLSWATDGDLLPRPAI